MYYVYGKHLDSGKTTLINLYEDPKEAIKKIASMYAMDKDNKIEFGEWYYYMTKR